MPTFKCNVNYFIAIFLVGSAFVLGKVAPAIQTYVLSKGGSMEAYGLVSYITPVVVLLFVALVWVIKKGAVCPIPVTKKSTDWFRIGNLTMTIANSLIAISLIVSVVGSGMVKGFSLASGFIVGGALMLAIPLNIFGIICVEVSRLLNKNEPSILKL